MRRNDMLSRFDTIRRSVTDIRTDGRKELLYVNIVRHYC